MKTLHGSTLFWLAALLEAGAAACAMTYLSAGPFSFSSEHLVSWLGLVASIFSVYFAPTLWIAQLRPQAAGRQRALFSSLSCAALFGFGVAYMQLRPGTIGAIWHVTSPIQPFPILAAGLILLFVLLLKTAVLATGLREHEERHRLWSRLSEVALPAAIILLGLLQATVYILPIGNASLRFWAIADGIFLGEGYPLTLTEPGPVSAGSPPYVYDLPIFPLLIRASFALIGHDSAALHVPGVVFSALFPLSMYLLIKAATGSRMTAVAFSALASSFPFMRFWVLNLPDPDPFFLTSLCFAAYLYLRALADRGDTLLWALAGLVAGVASLARPEGLLYMGFLGLGILAHRPPLKQITLFSASVGLFVGPMVVVWTANYGFLWPQNYNKTLDIAHLALTYSQLDTPGGLPLYHKAIGMSAEAAIVLAVLFAVLVLYGTLKMIRSNAKLLAIAVPAIGNTIMLPLTDPWISNAFHYADFFRHASFGIPFMVAVSAYGFHVLTNSLLAGGRLRAAHYLCWIVLIAVIVREADILANPTATHRPGSPMASQALTDNPHLSLQGILEHPMQLPAMAFYRDQNGAFVAYVPGIKWPDDAIRFFEPLDISYDTQARSFGYGSLVAFLLALGFAVAAEKPGPPKPEPSIPRRTGPQALTDPTSLA